MQGDRDEEEETEEEILVHDASSSPQRAHFSMGASPTEGAGPGGRGVTRVGSNGGEPLACDFRFRPEMKARGVLVAGRCTSARKGEPDQEHGPEDDERFPEHPAIVTRPDSGAKAQGAQSSDSQLVGFTGEGSANCAAGPMPEGSGWDAGGSAADGNGR